VGHDGCTGAAMPDTNMEAVRARKAAEVSEPAEDDDEDA
jgi:hypothetical protein